MSNFILAIVIVFGGWWLLRMFATSQPTQIRGLMRKGAGFAIIAVSGVLALRGALNIAIPLFTLGLGLIAMVVSMPEEQESQPQMPRVGARGLALSMATLPPVPAYLPDLRLEPRAESAE